MNNILKIYYEKSTNLLLIRSLKAIIADSIGGNIDDFDFEDKGNGFKFVYDGEVGGEEEISYGDKDEATGFIEIKADYAWNAIELYNLIEQFVSAKEV